MRTAFRLIGLAVLAVPIYWTADKLLQIYATSIAKQQVLAQVQNEEYLAELFSLPLPLQYANYVVLEGKSLKDNPISGQLYLMKERQPKPFRVLFLYTDGVERKHWFEYPTEGCTVVYCKYDSTLLMAIQTPSKMDVTYVFREKSIEKKVLMGNPPRK